MTTELALDLIRRHSVTPEDDGCMDIICARLEPLGFQATRLRHGEVDNLWLVHGDTGPILCFLGHTDVVPPGPPDAWLNDPFDPQIRDGYLYGRGAADMKGSIAAMVTAMAAFVSDHPDHNGRLALLLTSDEEGVAVNGTVRVVEWLTGSGTRIDWCVVGEPSSRDTVGDTIKIGRRGSLTGHLTVRGVQGHVAYPALADNPIHRLAPVLARLTARVWDEGNQDYDASSFQISNIQAGSGTDNVIPASVRVQFNIRYNTTQTEAGIRKIITTMLDEGGLDYDLNWLPSSKPFLTAPGALRSAGYEAVRAVAGIEPELSTSGGTSDGRFVAPTGAEVIELGPVNSTIHKVNECVRVADLDQLARMYRHIMQALLVERLR